MSVMLIAITELEPSALPDGAFGAPMTASIGHSSDVFIVYIETDLEPDDDRLRSVEWLAPRALHLDDIARSCVAFNVLPVRFGVVDIDLERLRNRLEGLDAPIRQELHRFRQLDEFRLHLRLPRRRSDVGVSGADYLRARKAALDGASAEGDALARDIAAHAFEAEFSDAGATDHLTGSILADQHGWVEIRRLLEARTLHAEFEGPLPPYHFVQLDEVNDVQTNQTPPHQAATP